MATGALKQRLQQQLQQQLAPWLSRWRVMPQRDQRALLALGTFVLLLVFVFGVFRPLQDFAATARADYAQAVTDWQWLQEQAPRVAMLQQQAPASAADPGQSLLSVASATAKEFQISFKRFEPEGDNGLRLWLEGVPFQAAVQWLFLLRQQAGIGVEQITLERSQPGRVDARLVLRRR